MQIVKERVKMENNISGQVRRILDREMELLSLEKHEYRKLRHLGSLIIRRRQYGIIFTEKNNGREKGITSDKARITLLGRKRYLKKSIPRREKVCKALQAAIKEIENVESPPLDFPWDIKELKNARFSRKAFRWLSEETQTNPMAPEMLKYATDSGIRVRSKSEKIIADMLTSRGLPFKYEVPLELPGRRTYPDFVIMRQNGRMVIWEHFGLMGDEKYAVKAMEKLTAYLEAGLSIHDDLICTFEKDIEMPGILENIIDTYLIQ